MNKEPKPKPRATQIREVCAKMRAEYDFEAMRSRTGFFSRSAHIDSLAELVGKELAREYGSILLSMYNAEIRLLNLRPNRKRSLKS